MLIIKKQKSENLCQWCETRKANRQLRSITSIRIDINICNKCLDQMELDPDKLNEQPRKTINFVPLIGMITGRSGGDKRKRTS